VVNNYGFGLANGEGVGYGYGDDEGEGYGLILAYGGGHSYGEDFGFGDGQGQGYGDAYGENYGDGAGYGLGLRYGEGDSEGEGFGYGDDEGYGGGFVQGAGYGLDTRQALLLSYFRAVPLPATLIMAETNAELKRILIEAKGIDKLFAELNPAIVHQDIDGYGHPRRLLAIKVREARNGELRAVQVVCPTTGREYILGVPSTVNTCQQAVASTFGMALHQYAPDRES